MKVTTTALNGAKSSTKLKQDLKDAEAAFAQKVSDKEASIAAKKAEAALMDQLNDFEKKLAAARPESESDLETEPSTGRFLIRVNGEEYDIYIEEQSNNA